MIYVWPYFQLNPFKRYFWVGDLIHFRFYFYILSKTAWGKFVEISSTWKSKSTWKLWNRFDVEISTWIWLSKSTKYQKVLHVDFSILFRRRIDTTTFLASSSYHFRTFSALPNGHIHVELSSISKGKFTWKLWHIFDVDSTFKIDKVSMISRKRFRRSMDVTSVLAVSIVSLPNIFSSGNLF